MFRVFHLVIVRFGRRAGTIHGHTKNPYVGGAAATQNVPAFHVGGSNRLPVLVGPDQMQEVCMRAITRSVAALLVLIMATEHSVFAVGSKNAAYFGGTITVFGTPKDPVEGTLDTANESALVFTPHDKKLSGKGFSIPYAKVIDLEYGQKAGRRVGAAIGTTILLGPVGLVSLFSKKRKHFLTMGFKDDDGKDQVAVIELGKDIVRTTLAIVQTISGKEIEYQDEEARKSAK